MVKQNIIYSNYELYKGFTDPKINPKIIATIEKEISSNYGEYYKNYEDILKEDLDKDQTNFTIIIIPNKPHYLIKYKYCIFKNSDENEVIHTFYLTSGSMIGGFKQQYKYAKKQYLFLKKNKHYLI
jgi:hypothetical protein